MNAEPGEKHLTTKRTHVRRESWGDWISRKTKKHSKRAGNGLYQGYRSVKYGIVAASNKNETVASSIGYLRTKTAKFMPHNFEFGANEIIPNMYLGNVWDSCMKEDLQNLGVSHILTVATGAEPSYPDDFTYHCVDIRDISGVDILIYFDEACNFIHEAITNGHTVLVHCMQGRSRSASCVIAYLMKYNKLTLDVALEYVQQRRPIAQPNDGFMNQLRQWERKLAREGVPPTLSRRGTEPAIEYSSSPGPEEDMDNISLESVVVRPRAESFGAIAL